MTAERIDTVCCIAGGGPAGMMAGFLLARAGIEVIVLEKHADFLRDFRGDTIHPSTLNIMYELGLLTEFLQVPHQELRELGAQVGEEFVTVADFSHLPGHCKFMALMPQWDFLAFLVEQGWRYPGFHVRMEAEATDLIVDGERITGVRARSPRGELEVRANLVIAADGRGSVLRGKAGLKVVNRGAPMDVLWMRLSKKDEDPGQTLGRVTAGHIFIMLDRGDYWQCAFVIAKGGYEETRQRGLPAFREELGAIAPFLKGRTAELKDWDQIKLLTVTVDRLREWYRPGFLCIGDAAHAMSPIGGVGINLAIQDAVAAANILTGPLCAGPIPVDVLKKVQRRREWPARATQAVQIFIQNRVVRRVLASRGGMTSLPLALRLLRRWPVLRRIPARAVGMGFRPEHVTSRPLAN